MTGISAPPQVSRSACRADGGHVQTARRRPSTRLALPSRKRGGSSYQTAPRPISGNGARLRPSPRGNIACGTPGTDCRHSRRTAARSAFAAPASRSAPSPITSIPRIWKRPDVIRRRAPLPRWINAPLDVRWPAAWCRAVEMEAPLKANLMESADLRTYISLGRSSRRQAVHRARLPRSDSNGPSSK
jgi:hypothetical protein